MHSVYFILALLLGLADMLVAMYYASPKYNMIWVMPLSFVIFSFIFSRVYKIMGKSIVATLLLSVMFLKNVIIPFFIVMGGGGALVVVDTSKYLPYAYFLSAYELLVVFFVVYKKTPACLSHVISKTETLVIDKRAVSCVFKIMLMILLVFAVIVILYPQMLLYYDYGLSTTEEERILHNHLSEMIVSSVPRMSFYLYTFLFGLLRWLVPIALLLKIYVSRRFKGYSAILLSIVIVLVSTILGTDYRAASLFILISFFLLLTKLYPTYRKNIYSVCFICVFMVGFLGLLYKSYGSENIDSVAYQELATILQAYFSGPENVAIGYMMPGYPTIEILVGDIFGFIPFVMYFFKDFKTSMIQFNYVFFNESDITTQIIPMISQGQRYFTILGAPLFTYILSNLAFKQELKSLTSNSIMTYSINIMLCVFLSIAISMYCMSQCITIYVGTFLPIILILRYVGNRYKKKVIKTL